MSHYCDQRISHCHVQNGSESWNYAKLIMTREWRPIRVYFRCMRQFDISCRFYYFKKLKKNSLEKKRERERARCEIRVKKKIEILNCKWSSCQYDIKFHRNQITRLYSHIFGRHQIIFFLKLFRAIFLWLRRISKGWKHFTRKIKFLLVKLRIHRSREYRIGFYVHK